jgi:predicted DNA-binding transcriptional regulator YafY
MDHPTTRVLAVLELLQTHGRMSGAELAERLEVDRRTLRRYISMLEQLGIPLTAERGCHGAYMLVAGFKLPPMMFTDDEALALAVGLLAARDLGLAAAAPAVASAQAKLERVMPANLRNRVRAVGETVTLEASRSPQSPGSAGPAGNNATLLALCAAALARQRVHLIYRTTAAETERDFDPYGLTWRYGSWYAVGMCHLRGDLRSFRLDRMGPVKPLAMTFTRPADFDAAAHLARGIATLPRGIAVEVLLATDLEAARDELPESLGLFEPTAGGVLWHGQTNDLDWFARQLARLPFDFTIRRPAELRQALQRRAHRLARLSGIDQPA